MKIKYTLILLLLFAPIISLAKGLDSQRIDFMEAYNILHKGGFYTGSHLESYPLHAYLDYERIKQHLSITRDQALINFIRANHPSLLAEKVTTELLLRFAKQRRWSSLLKFYKKGQGGNKAKCVGLEARIYTTEGKQKKQALKAAKKLWLSGDQRPSSCNSLFALLNKRGLIDDNSAWERISLAMEKGKTSLASSLAKFTQDRALVTLWTKLRKKPSKHLNNKQLEKDTPRRRQLITYAIKRIARKNTDKAIQKWHKFQQTHTFTDKEKATVNSYIGVRDALDHKPSALKRLINIPRKLRSDQGNIWMARSALRQGRWNKVVAAINAMEDKYKNQDVWRYWRHYANKRMGEKGISKDFYTLSENASFYGFLAADQLKRPYIRLQQQEPDWQASIPKIKKNKAIQRAIELYAIGFPKLAKKEWFWALKRFNKHEKLTAAAFALEINQPFLAIITVSQTKDWNQVGLRFPLEYKNLIKRVANQQGITPAWVYGIMRRESAFDAKISSSANAQGLMQILPRTAKEVARKIGIKNHRTSDLLLPKKNARLGAAYLSQMLKKFKGNYAKATASYNAGPHRIPRWTPKNPIVAPRWIESIPFKETRNYVRAVMSYTTIYDYKLNHKATKKQDKNLRLSQRLHPIGGNQ